VLIQQYVIAQSGWVDPDTLPGVTPSNVFVVNPLASDLQLNNHNILGSNMVIDGSANLNAVTLTGGRKICLSGTCRDTWPVVTGGITGGGTVEKIAKFTGASAIGDSTIEHRGNSIYAFNSGFSTSGLILGGGSVDPLQIYGMNNFSTSNLVYLSISGAAVPSSGNAINILNDGHGSGLIINNSRATNIKEGINITNGGLGNGLVVTQNNPTPGAATGRPFRVNDDNASDNTPFVVDWEGKVGIGTVSPNKNLHIQTASGNAEIDIQSGGVSGNHWGIYHDAATDDLFFWKDAANRVVFTDSGNINLQGSVCDINGANCFSGSTNYWTQDASLNLSRTNSNVHLLASGQTMPAALALSGTRMVWHPTKAALRIGGIGASGATKWSETNIGNYSLVFGLDSRASGLYSAVLSGNANNSDAEASVVAGGRQNQVAAFALEGAVVGGGANQVNGQGGFIGGGNQNITSGSYSVLSGGISNRLMGTGSVIGGGGWNIATTSYSVIGGGQQNGVNGQHGVVGGGYLNIVSSAQSTISGGWNNSISGPIGTIGGGKDNLILLEGQLSTIGGGTSNNISADYVAIAGGQSNTVSGDFGAIGGGSLNSVSGIFSVIPGGSANLAAGDYSLAAGRHMELSATADNSFVWGTSDTPVSITRDNSFIVFPTNPTGSLPRLGIGTSAPNSTVHIKSNSGNAEIDLQSGSSPYWGIYQDDTTDELRFWNNGVNKVIFKSNSLGVVSDSADGVDNYIQLDKVNAVPPVTDCDEVAEEGRMIWKAAGFNRLMICGYDSVSGLYGWRTLLSS